MKKTIEIALKWISPIIILGVLYSQIKSDLPTISNVFRNISFSFQNVILFISLLIMMFLNWFLESYKWRILVSKLTNISNEGAMKAILNGLAFGLFTPFRVGDIVTRIAHLSSEKRPFALGSVFLARSSQLSATLIFGLIGVIFFTPIAYDVNTFWLLIILIFILIIYYKIGVIIPLIQKLKFVNSYIKYVEIINTYSVYDFSLSLLISLFRYFVIVFQYYLMFQFFNVDIDAFSVFVGVSVTLMIKSILPIVSVLGDFGIREMVAIYVFKFYGFEPIQILSVTISIWLLNIVLPSVVGAFLTRNFKVKP